MKRAGKFALGHGERTDGHAKLFGELLRAERPLRPDQPADASQGHDGPRGPRLRPAVSNHAEARGIRDQLPNRLRVRPPETAPAPRGGQGGGVLAGRSLVGQNSRLPAHRLEYRRGGQSSKNRRA